MPGRDLLRRAGVARRSTRRRGWRSCCAGSCPQRPRTCSSASRPPTTPAVYKLDDERALVFTLDFFPPLVDDPALFGTIAATNALNDVFAMGGCRCSRSRSPRSRRACRTRRSPRSSAPRTSRCARRARSSPAGTRSATRSRSTGSPSSARCIPDGFWPKATAQPGDALFLTKPLGTGLLLHAAREGRRHEAGLEDATRAMTTLNRAAADVLRPFAPHAVTDVTGFGLLGHAHEMAERSGVRIELDAASPACAAGRARAAAAAGVRTGGDRRNRDFAAAARRQRDGVADEPARARLRPADRRRPARRAARRTSPSSLGAAFAAARALPAPASAPSSRGAGVGLAWRHGRGARPGAPARCLARRFRRSPRVRALALRDRPHGRRSCV